MDLNGFTIDRGLSGLAPIEKGYVIYNQGNLTIKDSSLESLGKITGGNNSGDGGAVYNTASASVRLDAGSICGNRSGGKGGAIYSGRGSDAVTVTGGSIRENTAAGNGGGIFAEADITCSGGSIAGNTAYGHGGGVAYVQSIVDDTYAKYVFDLSDAVITGNRAGGQGGGIYYYERVSINPTVSKMKIHGAPKVTGNTGINEANPSNVYLASACYLMLNNLTDLSKDAQLGVYHPRGRHQTGNFEKSLLVRNGSGENAYTNSQLPQITREGSVYAENSAPFEKVYYGTGIGANPGKPISWYLLPATNHGAGNAYFLWAENSVGAARFHGVPNENDISYLPMPSELSTGNDVIDGLTFLHDLIASSLNADLQKHLWWNSEARVWLNKDFYEGAFTAEEQAGIIKTITVSDNTIESFQPARLYEDHVFLLSAEELTSEKYGFDNNLLKLNDWDIAWDQAKASSVVNTYMLRNPVDSQGIDAYPGLLKATGELLANSAYTVLEAYPMRPGINIDKDQVLCFIPAVNPAGTVGNTLVAVSDRTAGSKLTLKDADNSFSVTPDTVTVGENSITFSYTNAKSGANQYVTAMVMDANGAVTYQGNLCAVGTANEASGELTIDLTGVELHAGDKLYVCSNQDNGDYKTNYASALCELSVDTADYHIHRLVYHEAAEAKCTAVGNSEYWFCEECEKFFKDAKGTTECQKADVEIAAPGHQAPEGQVSTCKNQVNCTVCGGQIPPTHRWSENYESKDADLYLHYHVCLDCGIKDSGAPHDGEPCTVCGYGLASWSALQNAASVDRAVITLTQDIVCNDPDLGAIEIPKDYTVTIDLNGHTIDRHLTEAMESGSVLKVLGNLTLKDSSTSDAVSQGKITGGYNSGNGGGIEMGSKGVLTIEGGQIAGNRTQGDGGGVYATLLGDWGATGNGKLNMSGGRICDNKADGNGGGVYVDNRDYVFTMSGGTITGNCVTDATKNGGGVYCRGNDESRGWGIVRLSGQIQIRDNYAGGTGNANNLYAIHSSSVKITAPLTEDSYIGVSTSDGNDGIGGWDERDNIGYVGDVDTQAQLDFQKFHSDSCRKLTFVLRTNYASLKIEETPHSWSATYTADANNHYHTCTNTGCGAWGEGQAHMWSAVEGADKECTVCDYVAEHVMGTDYTADNADVLKHYHVCVNCGQKDEGEAHTWGDNYTCTVCQYQTSAWALLRESVKINNNEIKLTGDVIRADTDLTEINIPAGVSVTIDLNGHNIDRNLTSAVSGGCVIKVSAGGKLILKDSSTTDISRQGKITGGYADSFNYAGGIDNEGTLILDGGQIAENRNKKSAGGVRNDGTFIMNGGAITGNIANCDGIESSTIKYGAGAVACKYPVKKFEMNGGIISGNYTCGDTFGGGVWMEASDTLFVSGSAYIYNNYSGTTLDTDGSIADPGTRDDLCLGYPTASNLRTFQITGALSEEAQIGVKSLYKTPTYPITVGVPDGYTITEADAAHFVGNSGTKAELSGGKIVLNQHVQQTLIAADFTFAAPSYLTYSGLTKEAAVTANTDVHAGEVTVKYYNAEGVETEPLHAGTYTVKIDVAESEDYKAATNLTDASWNFTIVPETLNVSVADVELTAGEELPSLTVLVTGFVNGESAENLKDKGYIAPTASADGTVDTSDTELKTFEVTYTEGNATADYVFDKNTTANITIRGKVNAATPTITKDLSTTEVTYTKGNSAVPLTITASVTDGGELSYQWYSNTASSTEGGTAITDATEASYTPSTTEAGIIYYYCVVTNTNSAASGEKTATVTSNIAAIKVSARVDAAAPKITKNLSPQEMTYAMGTAASALEIEANAPDGGTLTYQWYSYKDSSTNKTKIEGATEASYTPPTTTVGTTYYYCSILNTNNAVSGTTFKGTQSLAAKITVTAAAVPTYSVTVTNGTVTNSTEDGTYAEGASVTITANTPETGKQFKEWTWTGVETLTFVEGTSATSSTATFTMPAQAVTVEATYEDIPVAHVHSWSTDWANDATNHWHECTAEGCTATDNAQKDGYGAHVYDNDWDADCNTCGYGRTPAAEKLTGIAQDNTHSAASGVELGAMGLPATVAITTDKGEAKVEGAVTTAAVVWHVDNPTYLDGTAFDISNLTGYSFVLEGNVTCPEGVDAGEVELKTRITVTVSAADQTAAPTADLPQDSIYMENKVVTLTATEGAAIYYTMTAGESEPETPTTESTLYEGPIALTGTAGSSVQYRIRAIAVKEGLQTSTVTSLSYTISLPAPTYNVTVTNGSGGGAYAEGASVTITANAPETGKQFKEWTGADELTFTEGSKTSATAIFTMPASEVTVTATYEATAPSHTHSWESAWTTNADAHWHSCTAEGCGITEPADMDSYDAHTYDGEQDADCNVCGYTRTIVPAGEAPSITGQPANASAKVGARAVFTVTAAGTAPFTYQWMIDRNDGNGFVEISGATEASYTTGEVDADCDGFRYKCVVTNSVASVGSAEAVLTVTKEEKPPQETDYQITEGADQTIPETHDGSITIKCSGALADFTGVEVDGEKVAEKDYTLSEGSTILTFSKAYIDTLTAGKHTVRFCYKDGGYAETSLTVKAAEEGPVTPDKPVTPDTPDKPVTPDQPDTPDKPVTPEKPKDPQPSGGSDSSDDEDSSEDSGSHGEAAPAGAGASAQPAAAASAETGDQSPIGALAVLFLLSAAGVAAFVIRRKKRDKAE